MCVCVWWQRSRSEGSAVGSEGWEEGESEEEDGGERQEEDQEKKEEEEEKMEEKVTSGEKDGAEEEEERKRKAEASSSHPPAKKKPDDSKLHELWPPAEPAGPSAVLKCIIGSLKEQFTQKLLPLLLLMI